nr:hypothetical protein [Tanacetum cinerariifolium]
MDSYDNEINLGMEENIISNEFAVKLCLDHEVKRGNKVVKKELIVALIGEIYFVNFIINPEKDDVEPGVVLGRSFMRLTKGNADFGNEIITIYSKLNPFLDSTGEEEKIGDDWDLLLDDLDFGDIPDIEGPLIFAEDNLYLEEERPVIETMAYSDTYKKILDGICLDKMKVGGEIKKEEEEAITKIKGEALIEKEDPRAFAISIQLEGTRPRGVKNVNRGIMKLNHSKAEPMGLLKDVLCQVRVTTIIAKFLILDMLIARDTPIIVGRGFLYTCGSILNTIERITSTFNGLCHQMFRAAKTNLETKKSDSDDEEDVTPRQGRNTRRNVMGIITTQWCQQ